tara:strand:+ start:12 stop:377 length:366 start_codon:yes stop_codon:yes gene_type:complete
MGEVTRVPQVGMGRDTEKMIPCVRVHVPLDFTALLDLIDPTKFLVRWVRTCTWILSALLDHQHQVTQRMVPTRLILSKSTSSIDMMLEVGWTNISTTTHREKFLPTLEQQSASQDIFVKTV